MTVFSSDFERYMALPPLMPQLTKRDHKSLKPSGTAPVQLLQLPSAGKTINFLRVFEVGIVPDAPDYWVTDASSDRPVLYTTRLDTCIAVLMVDKDTFKAAMVHLNFNSDVRSIFSSMRQELGESIEISCFGGNFTAPPPRGE